MKTINSFFKEELIETRRELLINLLAEIITFQITEYSQRGGYNESSDLL